MGRREDVYYTALEYLAHSEKQKANNIPYLGEDNPQTTSEEAWSNLDGEVLE